MSDWDSDEPLGYGKPPAWTRFKKGQSGNLKGRPKKKQAEQAPELDSELDKIQRKVLDQKVAVNSGGKVEHIKMMEAIARSQAAQAAKGHTLAQRDALKRAEELEKREAKRQAEQLERNKQNELDDARRERRLFKHFESLKESQAKAWTEAEVQGREEPDFPWPHPDDIAIDKPRELYRIRGPLHADDVALYRFIRAQRDLSLARMVREIVAKNNCPSAIARFWAALVQMNNAQLPLRWQTSKDFGEAALTCIEMGSRDLEIEIERLEQGCELYARIAKIDESGEGYRIANEALKPVLKNQGYQSLAQFDRAYEDTDGKPPWPRRA